VLEVTSISQSNDDRKEISKIKDSVVTRLNSLDKISKGFERKLDALLVLQDPLTLDNGIEDFEEAMILYLKVLKGQKDLVDSYRKLKITEFDIRDKEQKIRVMNNFMQSIEGKTPEQIRTLVKTGKFAPVNLALASLFGEAIGGDPNASRSILQGMADWGSNENFDSEVPQLTVNLNLSEDEKNRMIKNGEEIRETINITPED
jgi:hypothetical protein